MATKEEIISILKAHKPQLRELGVCDIGLFGTFSRGDQSDESDIDILIDFEAGKENFDNYMAAYDLVESLFKNRNVEIITKKGLSPYIGPQILRNVVYV